MSTKSPSSIFRKFTTFFILTSVFLLLCSCLKAPLGNPATSKIDPDIVGYWNQVDSDGSTGTLYVVASFDDKAYLVQSVTYKKNGDEYTGKSTAWKAWVTPIKNSKFITMDQISSLAIPKGADGTIYPTAKYVVAADSMEVTPLKSEYAKFEGADTSEKITKIIAENVDDKDMYIADVMKVRRLKADNPDDAALMKVVNAW